MSSRAEYVGCVHEKFPRSSLPVPNSLFCCSYWLLFWASGTPRCWQSGAWFSGYAPKNRRAFLTDLDWACAMGQLQAGVPPSAISKMKAKLHITPCQHLGTLGSLLRICSWVLQHDMVDGSLPRQYGTDCTQPIFCLTGLPGDLPHLSFTIRPVCAGFGNTCAGIWTCGGKLWSPMSSDSVYCSWIIGSKCGGDAETAMLHQ